MGRRARAESRELAELRGRVLDWRRREGGGRGCRIPEELWQEAIQVGRIEGLHATARATLFNYARLKDRSGKAERRAEDKTRAGVSAEEETRADLVRAGSKKRVSHVRDGAKGFATGGAGRRFVAVQMAPPQVGRQMTIELVGRHGDRMRVDVTGEVDVVADLLQTFWSRPS